MLNWNNIFLPKIKNIKWGVGSGSETGDLVKNFRMRVEGPDPLNWQPGKSFFLVRYRSVLWIRDVLSRIRIRPLLHPGSGSRILGVKKHRIPDPTYFCIKAINKFCLLIPNPDPTIAPSRIPDPGGKKAPDPDPQHWYRYRKIVFSYR
jgi:hypothetical protein